MDEYFISLKASPSREQTLPISAYIRLDTLLLKS